MPGTKPIRCNPYRLSPEKAKVLKDELGNLFRQGIIEESTSPWASPVVMTTGEAEGLVLSSKLTVPYDFALIFVKSTAVLFQILSRCHVLKI